MWDGVVVTISEKAYGTLIHLFACFCSNFAAIATEMSVWDGVVVTPSEKAYEPPTETKEEDKDEEEGDENGDEAMESQDS